MFFYFLLPLLEHVAAYARIHGNISLGDLSPSYKKPDGFLFKLFGKSFASSHHRPLIPLRFNLTPLMLYSN